MKPLVKYLLLVNLPVLLIGALLPFTSLVSWVALVYFLPIFLCVYWVSGNLYHLYWSHKQFELNRHFQKIAAALGLFVMVGDPINYAKTHRWHHAHSDTDQDLHSPIHGRFHSLIGWMFKDIKVPLFSVRDLVNDKYLNWLADHQIKIIWATLLCLFLLNQNMFVALIYVMIVGFSLEMITNSFAHGTTGARNNYILACLCISTLHKNHHLNARVSNSNDPWRFIKKSLVSINLIKEKS